MAENTGRYGAVFFDVDDTLYDSTLQAEMARKNAINAMIEAGLDADPDDALAKLKEIVKRLGSNYQNHFDELLKEYGCQKNSRIVAAGVVAYHNTTLAYLVPYAETVPTLLELRDRGYKIGVITEGIAVKQWEKLIRLGLQHFFHAVLISEEIGRKKPDSEMFRLAAQSIDCDPKKSVMVGDRLDKDILGAKAAGMTTIQILKGKYSVNRPAHEGEEPDYVISDVEEVLEILE